MSDHIAEIVKRLPGESQQEADQYLDDLLLRKEMDAMFASKVSLAAAKCRAAEQETPLCRYLKNQVLPPACLSALTAGGSNRYRHIAGSYPKYYFVVHDFPSLEEGLYWIWELNKKWNRILSDRFRIFFEYGSGMLFPPGFVSHDEEILEIMTAVIESEKLLKHAGIGIGVKAEMFYDSERAVYEGLFSGKTLTETDLTELYETWDTKYPVVFREDPFAGLSSAILGKEGKQDGVLFDLLPPVTLTTLMRQVQDLKKEGFRIFCDQSKDDIGEEDLVDISLAMGCDLAYECGQGSYANRYLALEKEIRNGF